SINAVAFAPDGSMLASGGDNALIQFWNVTSGTNMQTLADQGGAVHAIAWSSDGKQLASSGFDGRIRVWEIQNRICVQTLEAHTNWVTGLAFAPNGPSSSPYHLSPLLPLPANNLLPLPANNRQGGGSRLASASWDRTVRLWDMASGQLLQTLTGHTDRVLRGAWSPDGTQVVSGGTNTLVTMWDAVGRGGGMPSKVLCGHSRTVHGVAWSPDGRLLASGGWDNTIRLWDATTGACLQLLRDPDAADT